MIKFRNSRRYWFLRQIIPREISFKMKNAELNLYREKKRNFST
jgi:hypothetical protein